MIDAPPESTRPQSITSVRSMLEGRRDDSTRRRQRVLAVLDRAAAQGDRLSASAITPAGRSRSHISLPATATCWRKSMRCKQIQSPMSTPARRSHAPRCRRICWLPTSEPPGSAHASSSWRSGCRKRW